MAFVESTMLPLGTQAPYFDLLNVQDGKQFSLSEILTDMPTVIVFSCNHCPYVLHINAGLVALANEYMQKGVNFIVISSNDVIRYPQDSPELMHELAIAENYPFPYLYDATQAVAQAYDAACTPDFYVFDNNLRLVYRGQMDGSRPGNGKPVTGSDLRDALDATLEGLPCADLQRPSGGCGIKWLS
jgi:peroxiredoxin